MKKLLLLALVLGLLVSGCTFYRSMYDSRSGMNIEKVMAQCPPEEYQKYLKDGDDCTKQCLIFNATVIGFIINELAFELITPQIYRHCMVKKGYYSAEELAIQQKVREKK